MNLFENLQMMKESENNVVKESTDYKDFINIMSVEDIITAISDIQTANKNGGNITDIGNYQVQIYGESVDGDWTWCYEIRRAGKLIHKCIYGELYKEAARYAATELHGLFKIEELLEKNPDLKIARYRRGDTMDIMSGEEEVYRIPKYAHNLILTEPEFKKRISN